MKTNIKNTAALKKVMITLILLFIFLPLFSQDATELAAMDAQKEDNRTIAEWSVFSGTQIFTMLVLLIIIQLFVVVALSDVIKNLLKTDKFKNRFIKKTIKSISLLICFSLASEVTFAASPEANSIVQLSDTMFWALITINSILLLIIFYLIHFIKWVLREMNPTPENSKLESTWWNNIMSKLTDSVPVEEEAVVLTDHEYDGIRELDNNLPPWWVWGFYVTIIFAFVYMFHFHIFKTGDLQAAEYNKEMTRAEAEVEAYLKSQANNVDEFNVVVLTDESSIAEGKTIFETNCWQCHKKDGGGQTGPNLTDNYWIHGGDIKDIFKTMKYGVTSKSMPVWKDQLTPSQMQKVSSYVKTLVGTKPAEPKAPEGDLYIEKEKLEDPNSEIITDSIPTKDTLK